MAHHSSSHTPGRAAVDKLDTGLASLVTLAALMGISADQAQLRRAYAVDGSGMDTLTIIRAARDIGLKANIRHVVPEKIVKIPLPAIAIMQDDTYVVLVKIEDGRAIVFDPEHDKPVDVTIDTFIEHWAGEMILAARRFDLIEAARKFNISWFIPLVLRYKTALTQVLGFSVVLQLLGLASPLFIQVIIDKVLVHRSLGTLDILAIGMIIVSVFQIGMTLLRGYAYTNTASKIEAQLNSFLFRHITALPIRYFDGYKAGDIVARVREMDNVRQFIITSGISIVLDSVFALVYIAIMLSYSMVLSLVSMAAVTAFAILSLIVAPIYKKLLQQRFLIGSQSQAFLVETLTGIETVKSLAVEPHYIQKWERLQASYIKSNFKTINLANVSGNIGQFIQNIFNLFVLWLGAHAVMDNKLTLGQLVAFQMMAGMVIAPILRLINVWQYFQQTTVSVERLGDILNVPAEPAFNPNRTTLPAVAGEIVLDRVSFRYRQDTSEVVSQLNLHIKSGARVGIVGPSGSGKSTLTKLIQRMYMPESGRVLVDGVDLAQVEPAWLRRQVGVVLQESLLFNGSIKYNIAIACSEASEEDIIAAAQAAGAHEFIQGLPKGYETTVGERGTALSGGQRQRIAIARALITNPRILIFDEATSSLDYEAERQILDRLDEIAEGRTTIIIAHRLSTVRQCDQIVFIDHGQILEQGTHEELIRKRGLYYRLYALQQQVG